MDAARRPLIAVTTSEMRSAAVDVPTAEAEPPQPRDGARDALPEALGARAACPSSAAAGRGRDRGAAGPRATASACPAAPTSTRRLRRRAGRRRSGPIEPGAGRVRARGRARGRRARRCRSSASAAAPGAERRARGHAAPAPARRRHGRRVEHRQTAPGWADDARRRRASRASRLARVLGATELRRQLVPPPGRRRGSGAGLRAVAWAPDGTVEGDRGRRRAARARRPVARRDARPRPGAPRAAVRALVEAAAARRGGTALGRADLMCGFGVEVRRGRARRPRGARADGRGARAARARRRRRLARRRRRARAPAAGDHRPVSERGAQPMRDDGARPRRRVQRLHLQPPRAARASSRPLGHAFFSTQRHRGRAARAGAQWGEGLLDRLRRHVRVRLPSATAGASCSCATGSASSRSTSPSCPTAALRAASTLPALLAGGGRGHERRPGRAAPLPELALRRARAADDPQRRRASCRPATVLVVEPDGRRRERALLGPAASSRGPERADWSEDWRDAVREALRVAVRRRMVADVPVGRAALRRPGLEPDRRAARRAGPARPGDVLDRLPDAGGREGNEFAFSDLVGARVRDRPPPDPRRAPERSWRRCRQAIAAMSEPMVSHDAWRSGCSREAVARERKVVQSGQGADEVLGGYYWYPPLLEARRARARRLRGGVLRPRRRGRRARC